MKNKVAWIRRIRAPINERQRTSRCRHYRCLRRKTERIRENQKGWGYRQPLLLAHDVWPTLTLRMSRGPWPRYNCTCLLTLDSHGTTLRLIEFLGSCHSHHMWLLFFLIVWWFSVICQSLPPPPPKKNLYTYVMPSFLPHAQTTCAVVRVPIATSHPGVNRLSQIGNIWSS